MFHKVSNISDGGTNRIIAPSLSPTGESPPQSEHVKNGSEAQDSSSEPIDKVTLSEEAKKPSGEELNEEEKKELNQLKLRDQEVKQHEQSHKAAAGQYARGGASFEYSIGPDGKRYAVGGEVQIDVGEGRTPEETIQKARIIRQAALAPAEPSAQDRRIAASAASMERQAHKKIAEEKIQEQQEEQKSTTEAENASETGISTDNADISSEAGTGMEPSNNTDKQFPYSENQTPNSPSPSIHHSGKIELKPSIKSAQKGYNDILPNPMDEISPRQNSIEALSIAI